MAAELRSVKGAYAKVSLSSERDRQELADFRDMVQKSCREASTESNYSRYVNNYIYTCFEMGIPAWPPTYDSVTLFMARHCRAGLSPTSLAQLQSALKAGALEAWRRDPNRRAEGHWLSLTEERLLKDWKHGALKKFGTPTKRRPPLTIELLHRLTLQADYRDLKQLQYLTMAWVSHDCLLRHRELANLEVKDVHWDEREQLCRLTIYDSKMNKGQHKEAETVHLVPYGEVSGYVLLRRLWALQKLHTKPGNRALFAAEIGNRGKGATPVSKPAYIDWIRKTLTAAGVPQAADYTGHSGRAGGATDLFRAGIPARLIQLAGRWRSEAYLIYIRDNPVARAKETFSGFASLARRVLMGAAGMVHVGS